MAGDWIKMRTGLLTHPEFWEISNSLGMGEAEAFLAIYKVAEWVSVHWKYGVIECSPEILDVVAGIKGVAQGMLILGWIKNCERGLLFTPKFPFCEAYVRKAFSAKFRREFLSGKVCAKCGSSDRLEIDHIKPVKLGGAHDESNLQALCFTCNRRKSSKE